MEYGVWSIYSIEYGEIPVMTGNSLCWYAHMVRCGDTLHTRIHAYTYTAYS
jgi:hypothetical protein